MDNHSSILNSLKILNGISEKVIINLKRLLPDTRIIDLLLHRPINIIKRNQVEKLIGVEAGDIISISVRILEHQPSSRRYSPYKVICDAIDGQLTLVFFHANKHYLSRLLPVGSSKIISGKIEKLYTIVHPDYIVNSYSEVRSIEPVYPLTRGITQRMLINFINQALNYLTDLPEWIPEDVVKENDWQSWKQTITRLHNPKSLQDIERNVERLAYDEFLAYQLQIQKMRLNKRKRIGKSIIGDGTLCKYLLSQLPFQLTGGQQSIIREIMQDQNQAHQMVRLLQGDVGSGKTVVALFAMLNVVEYGMQAALMAPTESLALQHYQWIDSMIGDKVKVVLLTGKSASKKKLNQNLADGSIQILIGTHALFQDDVIFKNIGLAVIDEQQRFGVKQRLKLSYKGDNVDLLLMSATPIPRTLSLTLYGDIDCSILQEKPQNRLPIITSIIKKDNIEEVVRSIELALKNDKAKIYWVCPLIQESEKMDMIAVIERFDYLSSIFDDQVGIVHGKMSTSERQEAMLKFKEGGCKILVATTVIEVGIDIPDANIIIVENAERFGLSQLHQLRGRVGRSDKQSYCLLLYDKASKITFERLKTIRDSNDGFYIAEQDLKIRGGGNIIGYKQSGLPNFKFINFQDNKLPMSEILHYAQKLIMLKDEKLELSTILSIFNYTKMI